MTWIPGGQYGRFGEALRMITDPFLDWFRRFSFMRIGTMDFSILGAFITLNIASSVFGYISRAPQIRFGIILAIIWQAIAGAVGFILGLFLFLVLLRLVGFYLRMNSLDRLWYSLDSFLQPVFHPVMGKLFPSRIVPYGTTLLGAGGVLFVTLLAARLLSSLITNLLASIPF